MNFNSPVSGRRSYKKKSTSTPVNLTDHPQHEDGPRTAEISSDESEDKNEELGSSSQEVNKTSNENDDSLEDSEVIENTFTSARCGSSIIRESADINQKEHSAEGPYRRREPSTPNFPPPSPRRSASVHNTNPNRTNRGGPHEDCVGSSLLGCSNFVILCLVFIIGIFMFTFTTSSARNWCEAFAKLNETLPKDIFKVVNVSVTRTLLKEQSKPTVLMFLQEDVENANRTVENIANSIIDCFDSGGKKETLDANYFESINDPGSAIELVKTELKEGGVLVVPNLQEIRGDVARAFHSICELNPALVQKLIVLFTLTPHKNGNVTEKNPTKLASETLTSQWKDLESYELNALVTRVTDHVVWLR